MPEGGADRTTASLPRYATQVPANPPPSAAEDTATKPGPSSSIAPATSVAVARTKVIPYGVSTGGLARQLGVREITIQNLVRYELVAAPMVCGGRRLWSQAEAIRVREVLVARGVIRASDAEDVAAGAAL